MFSKIFFFENRPVYEIMWKNMVDPDRSQTTIWCMLISRRVPKATNTHSEYVILIAFPLQQWLHERASMYLGLSCPLHLKYKVNGASVKECVVIM